MRLDSPYMLFISNFFISWGIYNFKTYDVISIQWKTVDPINKPVLIEANKEGKNNDYPVLIELKDKCYRESSQGHTKRFVNCLNQAITHYTGNKSHLVFPEKEREKTIKNTDPAAWKLFEGQIEKLVHGTVYEKNLIKKPITDIVVNDNKDVNDKINILKEKNGSQQMVLYFEYSKDGMIFISDAWFVWGQLPLRMCDFLSIQWSSSNPTDKRVYNLVINEGKNIPFPVLIEYKEKYIRQDSQGHTEEFVNRLNHAIRQYNGLETDTNQSMEKYEKAENPEPMKKAKKCPNCGKEMAITANFCTSCGTKLH